MTTSLEAVIVQAGSSGQVLQHDIRPSSPEHIERLATIDALVRDHHQSPSPVIAANHLPEGNRSRYCGWFIGSVLVVPMLWLPGRCCPVGHAALPV
jgi:hypothetical protein